jgi:hypothetical protein
MTVIRILFGAAFVWFLCLAAGQLFFGAIRLTLPRREAIFLGFLTGASLVSTAMFLLASGRMVYTKLLVISGFVTIGAWLWFCRPVLRREKAEESPLSAVWRIVLWLPLAIYGCLYFFTALMPETSADGTVYHLGLIATYYDHRGFLAMPNDMFAGLPEGIEMLFWIGFAFGKHSAAALVHLLFLAAMPFGMLAFGERLKQPKAGVVAALLFCLAPVAGKDATIAYIDTGTAVAAFGAFYCLWLWREADLQAALIPAGLLAGYCYACKMTAGVAIPFAIALVITTELNRRRGWLRAFKSAALTAVLAGAISVPWMVKSTLLFHDPFFPVMNHLFPNPHLYPMVEDQLRAIVKHVGNVPYSGLPYEVTVGGHVAGLIGPVFLLAPLALLSLRSRAGRQCLLACAVFALPFFANTETRFLLPALPFLSFALAMALMTAGPAAAVAVCAVHAYASWPGEIQRWIPGYQWRIDLPDLRAALRIVPEKQWLSEHWNEYDAGQLLDRFVPAGETVFSPNMGQRAYHHREVLGTFDSALSVRAFNLFLMPTVTAWATGFQRNISFAPVDTRRFRLQSGVATDNELRIYEVRFFDFDREIVRRPEWRLTASRNPWEVGLAFDNSAVSWWTSGQRVDPQTWIEVDFPQPVHIDHVVVDQIQDQAGMVLYPLAELNGQWTRLQSRETSATKPPRGDLRMAVRDELKAAGIRWILIRDGAYGADDLRANSPYWGVTQMAEAHGLRLWRLD